MHLHIILCYISLLCAELISAGSLSVQIHNDRCVIQAVDVSGCSGISDIIAHPKGNDCSELFYLQRDENGVKEMPTNVTGAYICGSNSQGIQVARVQATKNPHNSNFLTFTNIEGNNQGCYIDGWTAGTSKCEARPLSSPSAALKI